VNLSVQFIGDASKNCIAWVRGRVLAGDPEDEPVVQLLSLDDVAPSQHGRRPRTLSLVSAMWTIQEKMGFRVWTEQDRKPENLLLLMESRNFIRLDHPISLEGWSGKLYLERFNVTEPKWFWFQLDFDKVFER
jgi:hypothetical protein